MSIRSLAKPARVAALAAAVAFALGAGAMAQPGPGYGPGGGPVPGGGPCPGACMGPGYGPGPHGPGFGWRFGPRYGDYYSGRQVARDEVEAAVHIDLAHATKGTTWTNPRGVAHIPLLVDGQIVGSLWRDADLARLEIGSYWAGPFGEHVELIADGQVVGMIWVKV